MRNLLTLLKMRLSYSLFSKKGVGVIEIILILLVLVGLVVIFRTQLMGIVSSIFERVNEQINSF